MTMSDGSASTVVSLPDPSSTRFASCATPVVDADVEADQAIAARARLGAERAQVDARWRGSSASRSRSSCRRASPAAARRRHRRRGCAERIVDPLAGGNLPIAQHEAAFGRDRTIGGVLGEDDRVAAVGLVERLLEFVAAADVDGLLRAPASGCRRSRPDTGPAEFGSATPVTGNEQQSRQKQDA